MVRWVDMEEIRKNVLENKRTEADVMAAINKSHDHSYVYNLEKLSKASIIIIIYILLLLYIYNIYIYI